MAIKEKVIFDTNSLFNRKATTFLGNDRDFLKFVSVAEIIIPGIVIDELEAKYKRLYEEEKGKYVNTLLPSIMQTHIEEVDFNTRLEELKGFEITKYNVIELRDFSVLQEMRELAIKKLPPFEPGNKTDKGFKDAYIYFTILEYLETISDKTVFVCVKDVRFKKALMQHPRIIVIDSFDEFMKYSETRYISDYFINKINQEMDLSIVKSDVLDYWTNIEENTCLLIQSNDDKFVIEVDSGEIVEFKNTNEYDESIYDFVNSGSYRTTHKTIETLELCVNFLSDDEIYRLLEATSINPQVFHVIKDEDVRQFVGDLFEKRKSILDAELEMSLVTLLS